MPETLRILWRPLPRRAALSYKSRVFNLSERSTLGSIEMAKGQVKKNTGNKPKLSVKEKKQKKKEKAALKASS